MELLSAGGFNVHNVEAAEAHHKYSMHLTSMRVRHLSLTQTYQSMQRYLQRDLLFQHLADMVAPAKLPAPRTYSSDVRVPLKVICVNGVKEVVMGDVTCLAQHHTVLHDEVRVFRGELLDLVCRKFGMSPTKDAFTLLQDLTWSFGQKLVLVDPMQISSKIYWATDSQYTYFTDCASRRRRDNFLLKGTERKEVPLPHGTLGTQHTALCCQAICFIKLDNMRSLTDKLKLPPDVSSEIVKDLSGNDSSLILVLVRWFEAHPSATERDSRNLPLCPGNLNVNHCLWRFAMCSRDRPYLLQKKQPSAYFKRQAYMFGKTASQQNRRLRMEARAYYDVVKCSSISDLAHMSPEFEPDGTKYTSNWLQTVTLA